MMVLSFCVVNTLWVKFLRRIDSSLPMEQPASLLEVKLKSIPRDSRNMLILSCPEPSLASVVSIEYVIDALKMEEIGAIKIGSISPVITVIEGIAKLPYRLFYKKDNNLVTIRQHVPIPPNAYKLFIEKILDWADENGITKVICLTSIPALGDNETDNIYFVTEESHVQEFKSLGLVPLSEATLTGLEAEFLDAVLSRGTLTGALLLAESKLLTSINNLIKTGRIASSQDVLYILNQTVGRFGPDVSAAIKLIRGISLLTGINIPIDNLEEHAKKYAFLIEKNLEEYFKQPEKERIPTVL